MTPQEFKDALEKTDHQSWDEATRLLGLAQRAARRSFDKTDPTKLSYAFEELWGIYNEWDKQAR